LEQELLEILEIKSEEDIIKARVRAKAIAEALGFNYMDQTRIATAVSELTRNAYQYAGKGKITIKPLNKQGRKGMEMVVEDHGSGIENLDRALKGGCSTGGGLGMGLQKTHGRLRHQHQSGRRYSRNNQKMVVRNT
jgi:serine/threonine-protein kinase RsbT